MNQLVRVYVLEQSPRIEDRVERARVAADALIELFFDPRPRATPLLDASILLHYVTGQHSIPDVGAEFMPELGQYEPEALAPAEDALVFPSPDMDGTIRPATLTYVSYDETRTALGFLIRALSYCDRSILLRFPALGPVRDIAFDVWARTIVAQVLAGQPIPDGLWITDDLLRLLNLADGLSLNKQPGIIYLPWFHPFEMSNDLSGWNLVEGVDPIIDRRLWLKPVLATPPAGEPDYAVVNCAWRLSQTVYLYPGQALVSDADSNTGTRDPYSDVSRIRRAKVRRLGLVSMTPLAPTEVPRRTPANLRGPLPFIIALAPATAMQSGTVHGVRISGIEFFVDYPTAVDVLDSRKTVARLAGVLDLDGGVGTVVERVSIIAGQRAAEALGDDPFKITYCDGHLVQLGIRRPSTGVVFEQCNFIGSARGTLRFGPKSSGCLVVGGEFNGWLYGDESGMIQWDAGSVGNSVLDISIETAADDVLATLLMNGKAGAFDMHRPEPPTTTCDQRPGGLGLQFRSRHFILVGATGVDNVVVSSAPMGTTIRDLGLGTWIRDFKFTDGKRIGTLLTNQSWDNLLSDLNFSSMAAPNGMPLAPRWRRTDAALTSVGGQRPGAPELKLARRAVGGRDVAGKVMVTQVVQVWSDDRPPFPRPPTRDRASWQDCMLATQEGSAESARFEGMRSFVFVCRVLASPGESVAIALAAVGLNRQLAIAHAHFTQPADGSAGWQELTTRLTLPPVSVRLEVQLVGPGKFASPALVEGARVPSEPLATLGTGVAVVDGRLTIPDVTALISTAPTRPITISEPAALHSAGVASATPWMGGDTEIIIERSATTDVETLVPIARGVIRHGDLHAALRVTPSTTLHSGDLVITQAAHGAVRGGLVASQWQRLHVCLAVNQAI